MYPTLADSVMLLGVDKSDPFQRTMRIDAHHHLWRYTPEDFGWLQGELVPLRRDHLMPELLHAMRNADVAGTVVVQASQSEAETNFLLHAAEEYPQILGVVGWLQISASDLAEKLERYQKESRLKGLRHIVQAEREGFLDGDEFNRGIRRLHGTGLTYDILIYQHQLPEAIRFVDLHPLQPFVLNHLAKPLIAASEVEPWAKYFRELARRPNVLCKISGMVTEAAEGWTRMNLQPYFDVAMEAFSPSRLMVGSDWPVLTPRCTYAQWWQVLGTWLAPHSVDERAAILGGNAARFYNLDSPAAVKTIARDDGGHVA